MITDKNKLGFNEHIYELVVYLNQVNLSLYRSLLPDEPFE